MDCKPLLEDVKISKYVFWYFGSRSPYSSKRVDNSSCLLYFSSDKQTLFASSGTSLKLIT